VPADQAGMEFEEVPFGAGSLEHSTGIDIELVEDGSQFTHQGNIKVALRILGDLGGFGNLDGRGTVHPGGNHQLVNTGHGLQRRGVLTGNHLDDLVHRMHLVAGVDPLRGVADREVAAALQSRFGFEDRYRNLFGDPGVDGGFKDDDAPFADGSRWCVRHSPPGTGRGS